MFSARRVFTVSLLTALAALALLVDRPALAQTSYMGNTNGQPTFNRPVGGNPPAVLSANANATHYHTFMFTPTETAQYRIVSTATNWDNFIAIYTGTFAPASSLNNCIAASDDYGSTTMAGVDALPLQANQTYIIVVCGTNNGNSGPFETAITQLPPTNATTGQPTWARPNANGSNPPTTVSMTDAVPYAVTPFSVAATGDYRVTSTSTTPGFDNFTALYENSFSASQPLVNVVIANEDFAGKTVSGFDVHLTAGVNYFLVTTGSLLDDFGAFSTSVQRIYRLHVTGDTTGNPVYNRPNANQANPPISLSTTGTAVPYRVFVITVEGTGSYNFTVTRTTSGYDPFTALHAGSFDPTRPLANGVMANDDKGGSTFSGFDNVPLMTGVTYYLVVSGFNNQDFGQFTLDISSLAGSITLSDNRVISGTVVRENCPDMAFSASVVLRPSDDSGDITRTVAVDVTGAFTISDLPAKNFQLRIKSFNTLSRVVPADTRADDVLNLSIPPLLGGDADNSNVVDVGDLSLLIQAFDAERDTDPNTEGDQSSPNWNLNADFNCSGTIDVEDLAILIQNFDAAGEEFAIVGNRVITGTVVRQDCPDIAYTATFELHPSDNSSSITRTVEVSANGTFTLSSLPAKNYQIKVKSANTLSRVVSADATANDVLGLSIQALLGGDANNNNVVDVGDLSLLIQAFDAERDTDPGTEGDQPSPNWNADCDFNSNGVVDLEDLAIFIQNFDASGEDFS